MRSFVLSLALALAAAQVPGTNNVVIDELTAEGIRSQFVTKNVSFSFAMSCTPECYLDSGAGILDRDLVRRAYGTAYNLRAAEEEALMIETLTAAQPNINWESFAAETYFSLSMDPQEVAYLSDEPSIYNRIVFDRIVESTSRAETAFEIRSADGISKSDPTFWNIFIRMTMVEIPEAIADDFERLIYNASENYSVGSVLQDSIWVDSSAYFITDQLAPVEGRGHKDQMLLIPLILGVAMMLIVPIIITSCLVASQKGKMEIDMEVEVKEKEIQQLQRTMAVNEGFIQTYADREEEMEAAQAKEKEARQKRQEYEMTEKDVDWKQ